LVCKLKSETNHNIRTLRSDAGGEFLSTEFVKWLTEKCIHHETTVAHTPQQNGVIERDHRTTGEAEQSAMLNMRNIPQEAYMHIPACKLNPKSIKCIFVGYCDTTKAYRLWDAASRRIKN
jgi:transposase InsO family protein